MRKVGKTGEIFDFISQYINDRVGSDDEYILTIKKKKKTRTLQENKLIHVLIQMFVDEEKKLGNKYSFDEMKNIMKLALIGVKEIKFGDFMIQYPLKGTSELTIEEGIDFIEKMIYSLNTRYGLDIQSKDDERFLKYYDQYIQ